MQLWTRAMRCSDPGGLPRQGPRFSCSGAEQAIVWHVDGLGQRLAMHHAMPPRAEAHAPGPRSSQVTLCGCRAVSPHDSEAPRARWSPASFSMLHGWLATAAGRRVSTGGGIMDHGRQPEEDKLHGLPYCQGGSRMVVGGEGDDPALGATCAADGLAFCVSSDDCYPSGPTGAGSQQTVCNAPGEPPGFTVYNWKSTSKCKGKAPSAFYSGE